MSKKIATLLLSGALGVAGPFSCMGVQNPSASESSSHSSINSVASEISSSESSFNGVESESSIWESLLESESSSFDRAESRNDSSESSLDSVESESSAEDSSSIHTHKFGGWVVFEDATCQKNGKKRRTCICGEVEEEEIIVGHSYNVEGKCIWCGEIDESLEGETSTITLTPFAGAVVDILHPTIRSYIDNKDDEKLLAAMLKEEESNQRDLIKQNITFSWTTEGKVAAPYTLRFADNENFENAYEETVAQTFCSSVGFFTPGVTYYWKVVSASGTESAVDTFKIKDMPARVITAGSMWNVRDMGGWSTGEGQRIAYGKLYRGDDPNLSINSKDGHADEAALKVLRHLGIKGEIDLRMDASTDQHFLGEGRPYLLAGIKYYYHILPSGYQYSAESVVSLGKIFKFLADEKNYPVYFHCTFGKDRTGTLAYLIGGLLGMSYEDLMCDFELSSYGKNIETMSRNEIDSDGVGGWQFRDPSNYQFGYIARVHYAMAQDYPAATTSESIAKYLTTVCGVTQEEIAEIKRILIERIA